MDRSKQDQLEDRLGSMEASLSRRLSETSILTNSDNEFFRTEVCGLAAEITRRELEQMGYPVSLLIGNLDHPDYLGVRKPQDRHVICIVQTEAGPAVVDANYSQFFKPFGLDVHLQRQTKDNPFPNNRALVIPPGEVESAAGWCAEYVRYFWQQHLYSPEFQERHGYTTADENENARLQDFYNRSYPPIRHLSNLELIDYFANVWDLDNYQDHTSSADIVSWIDGYEQWAR